MSRFHDCVTDILRSKFHAAHPHYARWHMSPLTMCTDTKGKITHSFSINLSYLPLPDLNRRKLILA